MYPGQAFAAALLCTAPGCVGGGCWEGWFCYSPGSDFAGRTADRPAPAVAATGVSGLGSVPLAPATYTPECRKGRVEPMKLMTSEGCGVSCTILTTLLILTLDSLVSHSLVTPMYFISFSEGIVSRDYFKKRVPIKYISIKL